MESRPFLLSQTGYHCFPLSLTIYRREPEYRATRAKAGDFLSLCKNTPLACEVTLQPLERYPLDAAILFSDILTIPDALGLGLYFETGEGPKFRKVIRSEADVDALPKMNAESDLDYVMNAVSGYR